MVAGLEALLAKARCGELTGWIGVCELASGGQQVIRSGRFADDAAHAARVANKALDILFDQTGQKKGGSETPASDSLPLRLRM